MGTAVANPLQQLTLAELRQRTSTKWREHPQDVLPLWVAEMDVCLAEPVQDALRSAGELSAAECADVVGISRVSARRYLEHFVARGAAVVRLQYGGAGRPGRRYRPAGQA